MDINYNTTKHWQQKLKQKLYYREYYYNVIKKKSIPKKLKFCDYDFDESPNDDDGIKLIKKYKKFVTSNIRVRIDDSQKFIVEL